MRADEGRIDSYGTDNMMDLGVQQQSILDRDEIRRLQGALGTEQTMHAAWRKRAEEAEVELVALTGRCRKLEAALKLFLDDSHYKYEARKVAYALLASTPTSGAKHD